jgi:hypothetical protein
MIIFGKYGNPIEDYVWSPKPCTYVKWQSLGEGCDYAIFLDNDIEYAINESFDLPKVAWIRESKTIISPFYKWAEKNIDTIKNNYDYVLTHDRQFADRCGLFYCLPNATTWITETHVPNKTKLISMFNSGLELCDEHRKRNEFMNKFNDSIDIYGRRINPVKTKEEGLFDYMFSIVVENARYQGHFSEKLTDCFASKTIPIYWGGTEKDFEEFFDPSGVIFLDDELQIESITEELYYSKIDVVEKNYRLALEFPTPEDWIVKNILLPGDRFDRV